MKFRDLQTAHAISQALYSPPIKTPENSDYWPLSHKDKANTETSLLIDSMGEDGNSLLAKQKLEKEKLKPIQFMIAPARMSMRFSESHLRHLKAIM